ncbi:MAG TPA: T9SS type A sorting domain-containing protein [Flavipsychrobacter sp.]|nr:T9SS type A sorting domain-containing protein [Flavipsychrobacter sp.]
MLSLYAMFAKAQVFVTPTLPDNFLTNVTTSVLGVPAACPDDVTLNCDMLSDGHANPIKGIAWDEGTRSNVGHLYFEDGQGNSVFVDFNGVHPDIVLGDHDDNPGVDYRAAVVYITTTPTTPSATRLMIDFYDLTGLGTTSFAATLTGSQQLSTSDFGTLYDTRPIPHIDMWSDNTPGAQINGYPAMREFVVTWNETGLFQDVYYNWGRIGTGTLYVSIGGAKVNPVANYRNFNDVACYTDLSNPSAPRKIAAITYGETGNTLVVEELDFTSASPTATPIANTNFSTPYPYFPRIEAMSQWDGTLATKWQTVVTHLSSCWEYNNTSATGSDISTSLLAGGHFMSTAIAAGIGAVGAEPNNIGNMQYTPGYFEWWGIAAPPLSTSINYYARAVDAATGTVTDPDYYVINTGSVYSSTTGQYCEADASNGLALSNCSNSGDYLLSVWYDGDDVSAVGSIWYKVSGNTLPMQFKIGRVASIDGTKGVYPNPAKDKIYLDQAEGAYAIYNLMGAIVKQGKLQQNEGIDIATLPVGTYVLNENGSAHKFTKN